MTPTRTRAATSRSPISRRPRWPAVVASMYAVASIAALIAWAVVGDAAWLQPVTLGTFWWSLPAVVLAPLAFLLGSRRTATLLTVPAIVWVWSYGTAFLPPSAVDRPPDLRVASFNTYVHAPDASHVVDLVRAQDPDVLLLQELFPERDEELRARLGDALPHRHVVQSPGVGGVGVFSRFPITETRPILDASERSRSTAVVVLDVDGRAVQVVPVHLISPCPRCGASIIERLDLEGEVRVAEMGAVIDALDRDLPAVVGGDFNSTDRSGPYRQLAAADFRDAQREAGSGMGFTWPGRGRIGPFVRIDWLLARDLEPVGAFVGTAGPSDHRPVIADLAFPEQP